MVNALNLLLFDEGFQGAETDLFVRRRHFINSTAYSEKIRQTGRFHEINYFEFKEYSSSNLVNHLKHIPELFSPRREIEKAVGEGYCFRAKDYDVLLTPNGCQFFKLAMLCCDRARIYCYEDGTLSYTNKNWISSEVSGLSKKALDILGKGGRLYPSRVYLNNPALYTSAWDAEVLALPPLKETMESHRDLFFNIFGAPACDYKGSSVIFCAQPNPVSSDISLDICSSIKQPCICRYHPRNEDSFVLKGSQDRGSSQWELICADYIGDDHILVGACSSAQISPKWFFDKEPYVIFTYPIYGDRLPAKFIEASKTILQKTREIYRQPEKVIVVDTIENLNKVINSIVS